MQAKEEFDVGVPDDFPEGSIRILTVGGREIGIVASNGELYAVQNLCPHRLAKICLGSVSGTMLPTNEPGEFVHGLEGRVLRCPWHGWEFDILTGEAVAGIDHRRLATFPVSVRDDQVFVTMRARPNAERPQALAAAEQAG